MGGQPGNTTKQACMHAIQPIRRGAGMPATLGKWLLPPGKWMQKLTPAPGLATGLPRLQVCWLLSREPDASTAPRCPQAVQVAGGGTAPRRRCPEPCAACRLPCELEKGPAGHQMLQGNHETGLSKRCHRGSCKMRKLCRRLSEVPGWVRSWGTTSANASLGACRR